MINLINFTERKFPRFQKIIWKVIYGSLAWRFTTDEWFFMNYGYDNPEEELHLLPEDEKNFYFIHLYAHALSKVEVANRDLLEVGSGRGGGSEWIARTQKVRSMTGLDLSANAINLCKKNHQVANLEFTQGDAEQLPFPDNSFDIVLNIESSHHYPSMPKFLQEVSRVLRPGGYFCLADYREKPEFDEFKEHLQDSELDLVNFTDISTNVVDALNLTNDLKLNIIKRHVPWFMLGMLKTFSGVEGYKVYQRFVEGQLIYVSALLRKS